ncbi:YqcI/YcgG family protein [Paenibacillus sp. N3/727]|uniref:YqcI/YcgG family protein n=1 Tax=Paenibacillus sp. N3/727 TaxID=2925845 RepID=UPI001F532066|nr:YqcI/YcgG family protein [Paenibacillus sp. N3/727]UNK17839.1 YqcI/YcgG family protein [Paenibacillus sp. N3/727]
MIKPLKIEDVLLAPENHNTWQLDAINKWTVKMTDRESKFPCIPAVQGYAFNHLRYGFVQQAEDFAAEEQLAALLQNYGEQSRVLGHYTSLVVFIHSNAEPYRKDGVEYYERLFWSLLSRTTAMDRKPWPAHLPDDPSDHLWEYCYDGEPYFVYCGTPAHKLRRSRSFPYMVLAFTPRWVLEKFNSAPLQAEKTKQMIRRRLYAYDPVPPHPDLKMYGAEDNYEWRQYFLRDSGNSLSSCPFMRMYPNYESKT